MMMWNKIKIAAALVCVIAVVGTGSSWLARGRNAVEISLPAAEPPAKKERLPEIVREPADKLIKESDNICVMLAKLAAMENAEEDDLAARKIEIQLGLAEIQEKLRLQEQEWEAERQEGQNRLKFVASEIAHVKEEVRRIDEKNKELLKRLTDQLKTETAKYEEIRNQLLRREARHRDSIRSLRRQVFEAGHDLRRIENRRTQAREVRAVQRQALLARLEQLEEKKVGLEPADRLHDVERKLDALRREVGELRRAMERAKSQ